jgi:hypothetical protein
MTCNVFTFDVKYKYLVFPSLQAQQEVIELSMEIWFRQLLCYNTLLLYAY